MTENQKDDQLTSFGYCVRCLYPKNHPFGLIFNSENLCSGCLIHSEKNEIDWLERFQKLKKIFRSNSKKSSVYDCVVPVKGNAESFFVLHILRNKLGLKPLCVNYNSHYNSSAGIRNLYTIRKQFRVNLVQQTLSPNKVKKLCRYTLFKFLNFNWHAVAGQTALPVHTAINNNIPIIVWGAHQGLDNVGMYSHFDYVEMSRKNRMDHDLCGIEAEEIIDEYDNPINYEDISELCYPSDKKLNRGSIRGIYLNNYIKWDIESYYQFLIDKYFLEGQKQNRTFDSFSHAHCFFFADLHDYFRYLKFGNGKINDHVAREIRLNKMTKKAGYQLIKTYLHKRPKKTQSFRHWLGLTSNGLKFVVNDYLNRNINKHFQFTYDYNTNLSPSEAYLDIPADVYKEKTYYPRRSKDSENKQILFGHGLWTQKP